MNNELTFLFDMTLFIELKIYSITKGKSVNTEEVIHKLKSMKRGKH